MAARKSTPNNPDEAALRELGLSFPETTEEFPWDHRALKVKGKVFVFMGTGKEGGADHDDFFLSCKLPESAPMALTIPGVKPTGYGLGKSGWVSARWPPGEAPLDMLRDWLRESYRAVAPKRLAARLDEDAPASGGAPTRGAASKRSKPPSRNGGAKAKARPTARAKAKARPTARAKAKARPTARAKAKARPAARAKAAAGATGAKKRRARR
ncbi:MAG: MmcQ/YjbR family DNA-binding protein [Labilithrix sp.]|nr:MmcQ/YjbR family DNA-binding protein [Labilithrix sp.]